MSVSLPPELVDSILSNLCGTPSISECALVCHSWIPSARHYLWPPYKVLRLDRIQIPVFLRLLDSPGSTLPLIAFRTFLLSQNRPCKGEKDSHWDDIDIQIFLSRNSSFPSVTCLILEFIACRTLSKSALDSLHINYKSVKELELRYSVFTMDELNSLMTALPGLEKIILGDGARCKPVTLPPESVQMLCLRSLTLTGIPPSSMLRFFARAIQFPAIAKIDIKLSIPPGRKTPEFKACAELLETAGTSLRSLKLRIFYCMGSQRNDSAGDGASFPELVKFPHNLNLEEIDLSYVRETAVILLMEGLKTNAKSSLRQLKLGVDSGWDRAWTTTWVLVDETLSRMSLKDPKLIIDIPPLDSPGSFRGWEGFDLEQKKVLEKAYFEESSEKVRSWLPRTAKWWELEIVTTPL